MIFGRRPRLKTAEQVCVELDGLAAAGVHDAFIVDDNLIGNKKAIKPILREISRWQEAHGYPLSFVTEASIDLAEDDEMMQLMVDANALSRKRSSSEPPGRVGCLHGPPFI